MKALALSAILALATAPAMADPYCYWYIGIDPELLYYYSDVQDAVYDVHNTCADAYDVFEEEALFDLCVYGGVSNIKTNLVQIQDFVYSAYMTYCDPDQNCAAYCSAPVGGYLYQELPQGINLANNELQIHG